MKIVKKDYWSSVDVGLIDDQIGDFLPSDLDENGKLIFDTAFLTQSDRLNDEAFDQIKHLVKEIDLPNGIHDSVTISDCPNLTSITIPRTVYGLDIHNCPSLKTVNLSEGLDYANISDCKSLRTLVLPMSFHSLKADNFKGCDSLEKIIIKGDKFYVYDPEELNNQVFCNCKNLKEVEFLKPEFGKKYWLDTIKKNADAFLLIQSDFLKDEDFIKKCLVKIADKFGIAKAESVLKQKKEIEKKNHVLKNDNKEKIAEM